MAKKRNLKMWVLMAVLLVGMAPAIAAGGVIYVDADASPGGDGTSWTTAYKYLQDALADGNSNPDVNEIWVAEGTYKPDANSANPGGTDERTATFQLKNGVVIKGGYAGVGEPDPNARNVGLYETILSGDLNGDDVGFTNNGENSYHVVTSSLTDGTAILDGFTITAGNANGHWEQNYDKGGGMYNYSGSPTVTNCTFSGNSAEWYGGGMDNDLSSPTVTNCTFSGNSADNGGGMFNEESSPILTNCTFSSNSANNGGGMANYQSSPTVTNCTFSGNSAVRNGGGMANYQSSPTVTNCTFSPNSAEVGGGMCNSNGSSTTVTSCTFASNSATNGNAMACDSYRQSYPSTVQLANCILWDGGDEIWNNDGSTITITYSDIQGGWPGTGNIDEGPLFVGPNGLDGIGGTADDEDDNVHLRGYSPCINAGNPSGDYSGQVDLDGQPRVAYGRVDMGADEVFPIAGDFEPDGDVDFVDFAIFAGNWLLGVE